jgi:hypothetical protein
MSVIFQDCVRPAYVQLGLELGHLAQTHRHFGGSEKLLRELAPDEPSLPSREI